jgi:hypothetical protein
MAVAPWVVSDELWALVGPLLPRVERRFRYPGRKRLPDRPALKGILFVPHTTVLRALRVIHHEGLEFRGRRGTSVAARSAHADVGGGRLRTRRRGWRSRPGWHPESTDDHRG